MMSKSWMYSQGFQVCPESWIWYRMEQRKNDSQRYRRDIKVLFSMKRLWEGQSERKRRKRRKWRKWYRTSEKRERRQVTCDAGKRLCGLRIIPLIFCCFWHSLRFTHPLSLSLSHSLYPLWFIFTPLDTMNVSFYLNRIKPFLSHSIPSPFVLLPSFICRYSLSFLPECSSFLPPSLFLFHFDPFNSMLMLWSSFPPLPIYVYRTR